MRTIFTLMALAALSISSAQAADQTPSILKEFGVGDLAPTLKSARLIKGELVTPFDPNQTYVIEFWATWCGPCRKSLPHFAKLARTYGDRASFTATNVYERQDDPDLTYAEAVERVVRFVNENSTAMHYNVIMDDSEGTLAAHWQSGAGQDGIPNVFIVKNKRVLWIGLPKNLETPLVQVLDGTYDLQSAIDAFRQHRSDQLEIQRLWKYPPLTEAIKSKDYVAQLKIWDQAFAMNPRLEIEQGLGLFPILLHVDPPRASTYARDFVERYAPRGGDSERRSNILSTFAATLLSSKDLVNPDLDLALEFAMESFEIAPEKSPSHYSLLADVFRAKGDTARAMRFQNEGAALKKRTPAERHLNH